MTSLIQGRFELRSRVWYNEGIKLKSLKYDFIKIFSCGKGNIQKQLVQRVDASDVDIYLNNNEQIFSHTFL